MKLTIRFYLYYIEVCATELMVAGYKTLGAVEEYIKQNYMQLLTDELYTGENLTWEDKAWFDEIIERFPDEGSLKVESIIPL